MSVDDDRYSTTLASEEVLQLRRILDAKDARIAELEADTYQLNEQVAELRQQLESPDGRRWAQTLRDVCEVVMRLRPPADGERHVLIVSGHPCWHRRIVPAPIVDGWLDALDEVDSR